MPAARLILCEKTSRWAVALRRALSQQGEVLTQTRSLAACGRQLAEWPASLVVVEATAENLEPLVAAVGDWSRRFAWARFAAVAVSALQPAEPLLREAGASAAIFSPRQAGSIARLASRHFARLPVEDLPLPVAIRRRLPWPAWAGSAGAEPTGATATA